jgi:sulfotransferase famil protein
MRHVIVHYHIYKNAGSTIDSILKKNFGTACGSVEGPDAWDTLEAKDILKYALDNPGLKTISSHHARLPKPKAPNVMFHPLLFLRHPIDRVGSVYFFERRMPIDAHYGAKNAHEKTLREYVRWRIGDGGDAAIRNFQTVHLSGRERDMRTAVATKPDLERALERLEDLRVFGIVELFRESMLRMKSYLASEFGEIDTSFLVENRTADRKETVEERIDELRIALGPSLYDELLDRNSLDIELYEKARLNFIDSPQVY